jgi:hypothetical protein
MTAYPPRRAAAVAAFVTPPACTAYFLAIHHSPAYAAGSAALLAAFYAGCLRWDRHLRGPLGVRLLIGSALALLCLGAWQFLHLKDIGDVDHATYSCALWNLARGNWHYQYIGRNMLGIHSQYTAMVWYPVQALGGELGLKLGNGLCLIAAAALLLRRHWNQRSAAAWGALALLLAPAMASQFFFGFHPEMLAAPMLILALDAYRDRRLGAFLFLTLLLAFTKETFTLAIGGILLVALLERRSWIWILAPGLLCCAAMAVYWFGIMPHFAQGGNFLGFFFPSSPSEILHLWSRPQTLRYLLHIYVPFLPLLLALPWRYALLPLPTMAFYAAFPDPLFVQMWPNYAFPLAILCVAGLILETDVKFDPEPGSSGPRLAAGRAVDFRVLPACALSALLCYPLWREIFSVPISGLARNREVTFIRDHIGDGPSVLVYGNLAARFAGRRDFGLLGLMPDPGHRYDYLVLDSAFRPPWPVDGKAVSETFRAASDPTLWKRMHGSEGLAVFRRLPDPPAGGKGAP